MSRALRALGSPHLGELGDLVELGELEELGKLGELGESFAVPSCTVASHFHNLLTPKQWGLPRNCVGHNNGRLANGFSCDRIMCYIIDQRGPTFQKLMVGTPHYPHP